MKRNVGKIDKIIRILIAAVLVALYFTNVVTGSLGIIFLVIAGIALGTALMNQCLLYRLVGINSCKMNKESQ